LIEVFHVLIQFIEIAVLSINYILFKVYEGMYMSVDWHHDHKVDCHAEHHVSSEVINEHVVVQLNLMLSGNKIKQGNHGEGVAQTDRHL
jgi:hypothetical protein